MILYLLVEGGNDRQFIEKVIAPCLPVVTPLSSDDAYQSETLPNSKYGRSNLSPSQDSYANNDAQTNRPSTRTRKHRCERNQLRSNTHNTTAASHKHTRFANACVLRVKPFR
jgi:hypothetical protein